MDGTFVRVRLLPWLAAQRGRLLTLFFGVLVPLYLFGTLAEGVIEHESTSFDNALLMFVHKYATPQLDHAMLFFSLIGSALVLVPLNLLVFGVLVWLRKWAAARFWLFAVSGAALINLLAKHSFARIRPSLWISLAPEHTYSFPSGHAMESMAIVSACVVLSWRTRWRWPVLVLGSFYVLLVSASRVYLGVHYATDIAAAWVASAAWVIGLVVLFEGRLGHARVVNNLSLAQAHDRRLANDRG
jgi:undecaprenyl-diphosphatase